MTDPYNALSSFQEAVKIHGTGMLRRGSLDQDIYFFFDEPLGAPRFTYVRLKGRTVTALVMFARADPIKGRPCFGIGYAVPESLRNQGRAKEIIIAAIAEMRHGFRTTMPTFYLEAIIDANNKASLRVAEQVLSDKPKAITDQVVKVPAFQYVRKITQD